MLSTRQSSARFLLAADDPDGALPEFQTEIRINPQHVQALLEMGVLMYGTDSAAGIPYVEKAIALQPALPFGHYLLGVLYLDNHEYAKSIPELESIKKPFADKPELFFALGNAYARAGRKENAARARAVFKHLTAEIQSQDDAESDLESRTLRMRQSDALGADRKPQ